MHPQEAYRLQNQLHPVLSFISLSEFDIKQKQSFRLGGCFINRTEENRQHSGTVTILPYFGDFSIRHVNRTNNYSMF